MSAYGIKQRSQAALTFIDARELGKVLGWDFPFLPAMLAVDVQSSCHRERAERQGEKQTFSPMVKMAFPEPYHLLTRY